MKKKSTKIMALLLVCTLLMGTGYAYWTDSLNITTTTTTGNLDVAFADLGLLAQYTNESRGWSIIDGIGENGYVAAEFFIENLNYSKSNHNQIATPEALNAYKSRQSGYNKVVFDAKLVDPELIDVTIEIPGYTPGAPYSTQISDKIEITVNKLYPGYAQAFRTDVLNNGDLAAKLSKISIDTVDKSSQKVEDSIGIALLMKGEYAEFNTAFKLAAQFSEEDIFTIGGVEFVRLSAFSDPSVYEVFEQELAKILKCIPSKNRVDLLLGVAMDEDADNDTMDGSLKFTIDIDWSQFNADGQGLNAPANELDGQNRNAR